MAERRREVELSVERPLGPEGPSAGTVRLTVRLEPTAPGEPPSTKDLAETLEALRADLDALLGAPLAALPATRADREIAELIGRYRPRQRELVDLLLEEGEITPTEHGRLVDYLGAGAVPTRAAAARPEPKFDAPIAAAPIAAERLPAHVRPLEELLRLYQITTLKQAGAVRARRQISFEEYMALKRHFQPHDTGGAT